MTDEQKEANALSILDMCEMGDRLMDLFVDDILRICDKPRFGMSATQYKQAEELYPPRRSQREVGGSHVSSPPSYGRLHCDSDLGCVG